MKAYTKKPRSMSMRKVRQAEIIYDRWRALQTAVRYGDLKAMQQLPAIGWQFAKSMKLAGGHRQPAPISMRRLREARRQVQLLETVFLSTAGGRVFGTFLGEEMNEFRFMQIMDVAQSMPTNKRRGR